ncbi:outer membrane beta-barrel protein, partial [Bacteroidota bacterium]
IIDGEIQMRAFYIIVLTITFISIYSKTPAIEDLNIKYGAYIDTYIATDNNKLSPEEKALGINKKLRKFSSSDYIKNEFAINVAQLSAKISYGNNIRSLIVIHAGTLPEFSHGSFTPNIQQAWVGYNFFENIWLDVGYFLTHIGGEAYLPKDNWLTSHSMVTFFEPFYHAGVKVTYKDEFLTAGLHILNGNGIFEDNNDNKSLGAYLAYTTGEAFTISYAGIYGNEVMGSLVNSNMHMLHNICIETHPSKSLGIKGQLDFATLNIGIEDSENKKNEGAFMGFSIQGRYLIIEQLSGTVRFSYFNKLNAAYTSDFGKYDGIGLTGGIEYKPSENSYIRLEGRMLNFDGPGDVNYFFHYFSNGDEFTNIRYEMMLNFAVWFE